jgi:hypothetical protein
MFPDEIQQAIEALQSGVRDAVGRHLQAVTREHDAAIAQAKEEAAAEALVGLASQLDAVRAECAQQLETELAAARAEAERRLATETARAREEAEQAATDRAASEREALERALTAERQRGEDRVREIQERLTRELETERARAKDALEAERARAEAAETARAAFGQARADREATRAVDTGPLLAAVQGIAGERTLTGVFERLLEYTTASACRGVILLVNGDRLQGWRAAGFDRLDASSIDLSLNDAGVLGDAVRTATVRATSEAAPPPSMLALIPGRTGFAAPLLVGGRVVALLYADEQGASEPSSPAAWTEAIEIVARHASSALALVTATRTLQAFGEPPAGSAEADDQSARRYARLLVSEIKLYNESAVRVGREKRDLLTRLAPEIDRARRLYEERIPPAVGARGLYFHQELVQTLADGDPALLGQT